MSLIKKTDPIKKSRITKKVKIISEHQIEEREEREEKRKLSEDEIEQIISFDMYDMYRTYPKSLSDGFVSYHKSQIENQLKKIEIYPSLIPQLKDEIVKYYLTSFISSGEMVGTLASQSIGEGQTQTTLSSFHSAGLSAKTVTTGVPRFTELINATNNQKNTSVLVYFEEQTDSLQNLRKFVGSRLEEIYINKLLRKYTIIENKDREIEEWETIFEEYYPSIFKDCQRCQICLKLYLKLEYIFEYRLTLEKIAQIIESKIEFVHVMFSPVSLGILQIFVDPSAVDLEKIDPITYVGEQILPNLQKLMICGIKGVKQIYFTKKRDEWVIETDGSNMKGIMNLRGVDTTRTLSNNMWDIYDHFGVEATREFLINEFKEVLSDGYINDSHITLLVDTMLVGGRPSSVSRFYYKNDQCGPMVKASFEEGLKNLLRAGIYGERETTTGVSASIMVGKTPRIGSGMCDLILDTDKMSSQIVKKKQTLKRR